MGNCKDCRNWETHTDIFDKRWTECNIDFVERKDAIGDSDMAIYANACDDTGLDVGLKTGPMFGCVQFQRRSA